MLAFLCTSRACASSGSTIYHFLIGVKGRTTNQSKRCGPGKSHYWRWRVVRWSGNYWIPQGKLHCCHLWPRIEPVRPWKTVLRSLHRRFYQRTQGLLAKKMQGIRIHFPLTQQLGAATNCATVARELVGLPADDCQHPKKRRRRRSIGLTGRSRRLSAQARCHIHVMRADYASPRPASNSMHELRTRSSVFCALALGVRA